MERGFGGRNVWTVGGDTVNLVRPVIPPRPFGFEAAPRPVVIDLARTALVVVDMQNDFIHEDGWFAAKGVEPEPLRAPVPAINRLSKFAREQDLPVVWLNWGVRADGLNLPPGLAYAGSRTAGERGYTDPDPNGRGNALERGSWGAQVYDALDTDPLDVFIDKSRFGGFTDSDFDGVLRNLGVHTLVFAGINIDRCVFATLTEATFRGYDAILVEDAVATPSPTACTEAVHFLVDKLYGFRATSDSILAGTPEEPS
ncbi:MAG: cysteine hydrolase [Alphaproteobacteria bacterium]|nr:cysteine hydrolase [Alphaproteobacteria bacterium]